MFHKPNAGGYESKDYGDDSGGNHRKLNEESPEQFP